MPLAVQGGCVDRGEGVVSDFEFYESLIERYKVLQHPGEDGLTQDEAVELLSICIILGNRGYRQTEDEEDWLPPFTPD